MTQRYSRDPFEQGNRQQSDYRRNEERHSEIGRYGWEQQNREPEFGGNYATSGDEWRGTADRVPEYPSYRGGQDRYSQGNQGYYGGQGQSGIAQRLFGYDMGGGQYDPSHQNWGQQDRPHGWGEYGAGADALTQYPGRQQQWGSQTQTGRYGQTWGGFHPAQRGSQSWGPYGPRGPGVGQGGQWGGGELYNDASDIGSGSHFSDYNEEWRSRYGSLQPVQRSTSGHFHHRGRGPKGYQRTDQRIQEDVCERLSDDPYLDVSEVTVNVKEGVVTLEGSVNTRSSKHRIEDIADSCSGVKDVQNRLMVTNERWGSQQDSNDKNRQPQDKSRDLVTEH